MKQSLLVCEYLSGGGLADGAGPARAALLGQGVAMRDALLADLLRVPGLAIHLAVDAALPGVPGTTRVAPRSGEAMVDFVRREAAGHDFAWIVAPETGGLLAALADAVGAPRWLGCSADAVRLCSAKRATLERLAAHGVATPLACGREARRWVVKPDDGAGTLDTWIHRDRDAAEADRDARRTLGASATLEPWVEGEPLSLSLLCRDGETELLSINRQRIAVGADGRVDYRGVAINQIGGSLVRAGALHNTARAVGRAVRGLRGFVGVDLVWHAEHGPVVIEVNPRLTCAYVGLSAALGRNLAGEIVAEHAEALHVAA